MHDINITYLQILQCLGPSVIRQISTISTVRPEFIFFFLIFLLILHIILFLRAFCIITTWARNSRRFFH